MIGVVKVDTWSLDSGSRAQASRVVETHDGSVQLWKDFYCICGFTFWRVSCSVLNRIPK